MTIKVADEPSAELCGCGSATDGLLVHVVGNATRSIYHPQVDYVKLESEISPQHED